MEKIELEIVGLSYSQTQSGAYALVLGENEGKRRLPIIIGGFEAQAIAIELEGMTPSRPLTHDLFKSLTEKFDIHVKEVIVYNLVEGIFFAKVIADLNGVEQEIDARTSDAIALAVRYRCPVYTYEFILSSAGIILEDEDQEGVGEEEDKTEIIADDQAEKPGLKGSSISDLEKQLQEAIDMEDYEKASKIRDEINRRNQN
jgi:bifunctional DNase/RNase